MPKAVKKTKRAGATMEERMQNPVNQDLAGGVADTLAESIKEMGAAVGLADYSAICRMAKVTLTDQGVLGRKSEPRTRWATPDEFELKLGDDVQVKKGGEVVEAQFVSWTTRAIKGYATVLLDNGDVSALRVIRPEEEPAESSEQDESDD